MENKKHSFLIRLRSSVIIVLLAGGALWCGGLVLFLAVAAVSLIGLFEMLKAMGLRRTALEAAAFMGTAIYLEAVWLGWDKWLMFALFLAFMLIMGTYVFTFPKYKAEQAAQAVFAVLYIPVMLSYIYRVDALTESIAYSCLVLLPAWVSDVGAYCVGMLIGKHKLTPRLSPGKTVEGAAGAVVFSAAVGALFGLILKDQLGLFETPWLAVMILFACGSVLGQIGDLAASAIKRSHEIKDYGNIIPGHGGIMDRFDSVIVTAPVIDYLILLLMK